MVFYDNHGRPTAYTEDDVHIFLFTGEPVAYLDGDAVYGFNGHQFGGLKTAGFVTWTDIAYSSQRTRRVQGR